jgi:hypothetical protein
VPAEPKSKGFKIALWFACSVVVAMTPLGVNWLNGRVNGKPPGWVELLAGGELLLLAGALAADAVGRACLGGEKLRAVRIFLGIFAGILLLAVSIYFGRIAFGLEEHRVALADSIQSKNLDLAVRLLAAPGEDRATVASDSLWLFGFTLICAFCVLIIEEGPEPPGK